MCTQLHELHINEDHIYWLVSILQELVLRCCYNVLSTQETPP